MKLSLRKKAQEDVEEVYLLKMRFGPPAEGIIESDERGTPYIEEATLDYIRVRVEEAGGVVVDEERFTDHVYGFDQYWMYSQWPAASFNTMYEAAEDVVTILVDQGSVLYLPWVWALKDWEFYTGRLPRKGHWSPGKRPLTYEPLIEEDYDETEP